MPDAKYYAVVFFAYDRSKIIEDEMIHIVWIGESEEYAKKKQHDLEWVSDDNGFTYYTIQAFDKDGHRLIRYRSQKSYRRKVETEEFLNPKESLLDYDVEGEGEGEDINKLRLQEEKNRDFKESVIDSIKIGNVTNIKNIISENVLSPEDAKNSLQEAVKNQRVAVVKELLTIKLKFDDRNYVITATKFSNVEMVRVLLEAGFSASAQEDTLTALHWAIFYKNYDIICLLLKHNANINTANKYKVTPLDIVAKSATAARMGYSREDMAKIMTTKHGDNAKFKAFMQEFRKEALT
jgi:hypothetical protein